MSKQNKLNENGLVPLLVLILIIVIAVIYLAYTRVLHSHKI